MDGLSLVASLYRDISACSEHLTSDEMKRLHIRTSVEPFLIRSTSSRTVVLLTGGPGDGKTHLLRMIAPELKKVGAITCLDANQMNDEDISSWINDRHVSGQGGAMAINAGILMPLLRRHKDDLWAIQALEQIQHPYSTGDSLAPVSTLVVNLSHRNNLGRDVVEGVIDRIVTLAGENSDCPSAIKRNIAALNNSEVRQRLVDLIVAARLIHLQATMRDIMGFVSFLVCGGGKPSRAHSYYRNAFEGGRGALFDAIRQMDPTRVADPRLDLVLWKGTSEGWDVEVPRPVSKMSLSEFRDSKRRAFFERHDAHRLRKASFDGAANLGAEHPSAMSVEAVVSRLNGFFSREDRSSEALHLWLHHQYESGMVKFISTMRRVLAEDLEIRVPLLRSEIRHAFPEHDAGFVTLCLTKESDLPGLKIDPKLLGAISRAGGFQSTQKQADIEGRIFAFYDGMTIVARQVGKRPTVRAVDLSSGRETKISVVVEKRTYAIA